MGASLADCIFCKIAAKAVKSEIVYEDDRVVAFKDINPVAPVHLLIIPRAHYASLLDIPDAEIGIVGHIHSVIQRLARETGVDKSGFRVVNNCGPDGGQVVFHVHFHLIGGKPLGALGRRE